MNSIHVIMLIAVLLPTTALSQYTNGARERAHDPLKNTTTWELAKPAHSTQNSLMYDFRKTRWGMSRDQVKATETGRIEKDDAAMLVYSDVVSGIDAYVVYFFTYDKLTRTQYAFKRAHANENEYLGDFQNIKMTLSHTYGSPRVDKQFWNNELYRDDHKRWGFAISIGHLSFITQWTNESTDITLMLTGKKYAINFLIDYESKILNAQNQTIGEQHQSGL